MLRSFLSGSMWVFLFLGDPAKKNVVVFLLVSFETPKTGGPSRPDLFGSRSPEKKILLENMSSRAKPPTPGLPGRAAKAPCKDCLRFLENTWLHPPGAQPPFGQNLGSGAISKKQLFRGLDRFS